MKKTLGKRIISIALLLSIMLSLVNIGGISTYAEGINELVEDITIEETIEGITKDENTNIDYDGDKNIEEEEELELEGVELDQDFSEDIDRDVEEKLDLQDNEELVLIENENNYLNRSILTKEVANEEELKNALKITKDLNILITNDIDLTGVTEIISTPARKNINLIGVGDDITISGNAPLNISTTNMNDFNVNIENITFSNNSNAALLVRGKDSYEGKVNLTLNNVEFSENTGNSSVLWLDGKNDVIIENRVVFRNNRETGDIGGAIYGEYINILQRDNSELIFEGNSAKIGGAIGAYKELNIIGTDTSNLEFRDNESLSQGGAINLGRGLGRNGTSLIASNAKLNLPENTKFTSNSASNFGGAIAFEGKNSNYRIVRNIFENNKLDSSNGSKGGAIYIIGSSNLDLDGNEFEGNEAVYENKILLSSGGAIYAGDKSTLSLKNNTFNNNKASNGGAIAFDLEGSRIFDENFDNFVNKYDKVILRNDDSNIFSGNISKYPVEIMNEYDEDHILTRFKNVLMNKGNDEINLYNNNDIMLKTKLKINDVIKASKEVNKTEVKVNESIEYTIKIKNKLEYLADISILELNDEINKGINNLRISIEVVDDKGISHNLNDEKIVLQGNILKLKDNEKIVLKNNEELVIKINGIIGEKLLLGGKKLNNKVDIKVRYEDRLLEAFTNEEVSLKAKEVSVGAENTNTIDPDEDKDDNIGPSIPDIVKPILPKEEIASLDDTLHIKYLEGYEDKTIRPEDEITRAEVSAIIYRIMDDARRNKILSTDYKYIDQMYKWSREYIATLSNGGILEGYPDRTFRPNDNITRAEVAAMIARYNNVLEGKNTFVDVKGHWAEKEIGAVLEKEWIEGYEDGSFRPDAPILRAELVTIINRMLDRAVIKDQIPTDKITEYSDLNEGKWYYEDIVEASNEHYFKKIQDIEKVRGNEQWIEVKKIDLDIVK